MTFDAIIIPIIIAFLTLAIINIVIRFTVFRMYGELRKKGVEISSKSFFDSSILESELKGYPGEADTIRRFVKRTKMAMSFASVMIILVLIVGYSLMANR